VYVEHPALVDLPLGVKAEASLADPLILQMLDLIPGRIQWVLSVVLLG
jgi:hypothetical protein